MTPSLSSRERMLAAIANQEPDYVPCSFMIFAALRDQCKDQFELIERQVEMGLDTTVGIPPRPARRDRATSEQGDLHGLPVRFAPEVEVKDWREDKPGERYPILHREYTTPAGKLHTAVNKTKDWVQGDRIPLFDDFVIPRSRDRLITGLDDLPALRYLLTPTAGEDLAALKESSARAKALAAKHDLLTVGEWSSLFDTACWLCGMRDLVMKTIDEPEFVKELFALISEWNRGRMEVVLSEGIDLLIHRAWYESTDFWSPALYEQFILPELKKHVDLAHSMGAKFALISTSAYRLLLDFYLEAGIDVLIGLDPVQDVQADFEQTKRKLGGKVCLWGGVNGFVTVEQGTPDEVRQAVRDAMRVLAPGGGFILSPVDNVTLNEPHVWANVDAFIETWRECR